MCRLTCISRCITPHTAATATVFPRMTSTKMFVRFRSGPRAGASRWRRRGMVLFEYKLALLERSSRSFSHVSYCLRSSKVLGWRYFLEISSASSHLSLQYSLSGGKPKRFIIQCITCETYNARISTPSMGREHGVNAPPEVADSLLIDIESTIFVCLWCYLSC